jgi:hypothetical protein
VRVQIRRGTAVSLHGDIAIDVPGRKLLEVTEIRRVASERREMVCREVPLNSHSTSLGQYREITYQNASPITATRSDKLCWRLRSVAMIRHVALRGPDARRIAGGGDGGLPRILGLCPIRVFKDVRHNPFRVYSPKRVGREAAALATDLFQTSCTSPTDFVCKTFIDGSIPPRASKFSR